MTIPAKTRRIGPGRFQWNAGAWFGSMFGSTIWMLILAGYSAPPDPVVSMLVGGSYLICILTTIVFWLRRDRLLPYPSIQHQLAIIGALAALSLWIVFERLDADALRGTNGGQSVSLWVLVIFPLLMIQFHYLERSARREKLAPTDES